MRAQEQQQDQVNVLRINEKDRRKGGYGGLVSAIRRDREQEPLRNQQHIEAEDAEISRTMNIENVINKSPLLWKVNKVSRKAKYPKKTNTRQLETANTLTERVEHYDPLTTLDQANAGSNISQLLWDDGKEAEAMARELFRGNSRRKIVAAIERKAVPRAAVFDGSQQLKVFEVSVFGSTAQVLFDSGAVPNVMTTSMCSQLHLLPHSINRRRKMIAGSEDTVLGKVGKVPITVGGMPHALTYFDGK